MKGTMMPSGSAFIARMLNRISLEPGRIPPTAAGLAIRSRCPPIYHLDIIPNFRLLTMKASPTFI